MCIRDRGGGGRARAAVSRPASSRGPAQGRLETSGLSEHGAARSGSLGSARSARSPEGSGHPTNSLEKPGTRSYCEDAMRGWDGCKPRTTHWSQLASYRKQTFSLINTRGGPGNRRQQNKAEKALSHKRSYLTKAQVPRAPGSQTEDDALGQGLGAPWFPLPDRKI